MYKLNTFENRIIMGMNNKFKEQKSNRHVGRTVNRMQKIVEFRVFCYTGNNGTADISLSIKVTVGVPMIKDGLLLWTPKDLNHVAGKSRDDIPNFCTVKATNTEDGGVCVCVLLCYRKIISEMHLIFIELVINQIWNPLFCHDS